MTEDHIDLKEYVDTRFDGFERLLDARFSANDRAIALAKAETDHRLEELNNLRSQYVNDRSEFMTRKEMAARDGQVDDRHAILSGLIGDIGKQVSNMQGRAAAYVVAISIGLVVLQVVLSFALKNVGR
jgi:hypothetical protein